MKIRDWSDFCSTEDFQTLDQPMSHMQFGWGDRGFYIETPTWNDVRIGTVLGALFWSEATVMHVAYRPEPLADADCRRVPISHEQYAKLVADLQQCFRLDASGDPVVVPGAAYHTRDAFYEAVPTYHLLNTCNCWTGRVLRSAGIRCGIWTPFTASVMWTLPQADSQRVGSSG